MIKIIAQKSIQSSVIFYEIIYDNISLSSDNQLSLLITLWNHNTFSHIKDHQNFDNYDGILIRYQLFDDPNYYILFYDSNLDEYWENVCYQKYGFKEFVWDKETPVLKFSKLNFISILEQWRYLLKNPTKYFIATQKDTGWIDLQGTNELFNQDQKLVDDKKIIE